MFPLYDTIKASRFPFFNWAIVFITVFVFIQQFMTPDVDAFITKYALIPALVDFTNPITLLPFVTSIFLHGGLMHIISNMWFLVVFGDNVNDNLGVIGYLLLYFAAGIIGNFAQYILAPQSAIPMLGASGAVAGILGCYMVLFPYAKVKTLIFILFFVTIIEISAPIMLGYWFVLQIFSGVASIETLNAETGGVAFFAHIAGFVVGLLFGYFYKNRARTGEYYSS
jgi:membrane associated rhomboid family serine protease